MLLTSVSPYILYQTTYLKAVPSSCICIKCSLVILVIRNEGERLEPGTTSGSTSVPIYVSHLYKGRKELTRAVVYNDRAAVKIDMGYVYFRSACPKWGRVFCVIIRSE